jgi:hypothetical protein
MIACSYKRTFLRDLLEIDPKVRYRIEKIVFEDIQASRDLNAAFTKFDVRNRCVAPGDSCAAQQSVP